MIPFYRYPSRKLMLLWIPKVAVRITKNSLPWICHLQIFNPYAVKPSPFRFSATKIGSVAVAFLPGSSGFAFAL